MEFLNNTPFVLRLLLTLGLILVVNRISGSLLLGATLGTLALGLWSGNPPQAAALIAWQRLVDREHLFLLLVIFQVIWLSLQMQAGGVMGELVARVRARLSRRSSMAVLPALIGLLPMPGGALFSAPMVDDCDDEQSTRALLKAKINFWFRHIWEYWWPLYPGVLLAVHITGLPLWQFILIQLPFTFFSLLAGCIFLLRQVPDQGRPTDSEPGDLKPILPLLLPILTVVVVYVLVRLLLPGSLQLSRYLPMVLGLLAAQILLQIERPLSAARWRPILFSGKALKMAAVVALIRVYGAFIESRLSDGSLLMEQVRAELAALSVPVVLIAMLVPFVSALTTGIAIGFVGASFPIVVQLLGANPAPGELLAYTVLAYGAGYAGMMLSPVHICLVVSNEYFRSSLLHSIVRLARPAALIVAGALLWHLILLAIF